MSVSPAAAEPQPASPPPESQATGKRRGPLRPFLAVLLAGHLLTSSALLQAVGPEASRLGLLGFAIACGAVALAAIWWGGRLAVVAAGLLCALVLGQIALFAQVSGEPAVPNMIFSVLPLVAIPLFALAADDLEWQLGFLFTLSVGYCAVYVLLAAQAGEILPGGRLLAAHGGSGTRLFLSSGYAAYAGFAALARLRQGWAVAPALAFAAAGLAIYLAGSRAFEAIFVGVALLYLLAGVGRQVRLLLGGVLLLAVLANLGGLVIPGWNPYALVAGDPSGAARQQTYAAVVPLLRDHFVLGLGLPSTPTGFWTYIRRPYTFWDDLGPLGVWATFGVIGLTGFLGLAALCVAGVRRPPDLGLVSYRPLTLTALVFGLSAGFSPDLIGGTSSAFGGLLLGLALRSHRQAPPQTPAVEDPAQGPVIAAG